MITHKRRWPTLLITARLQQHVQHRRQPSTYLSLRELEDCQHEEAYTGSLDKSPDQTAPYMTTQVLASEHTMAAGITVPLTQDNTLLRVDWADPLRLHNHMYGSARRLRDAAGDKCLAKNTSIGMLAQSRNKDVILDPERKQQLLPQHHMARYKQLPPIQRTDRLHQPAAERNLPIQHQLPLVLCRATLGHSSCPDHQPCCRHLQLPPIITSFSDFEGLSALQLHRLQMLQAEHNDYMVQYGRWN
jgi:hypothetical protein